MSSWLYPLYDVHGNVKATLTRSGATGYSTANWKSYDVWGGERASTGSGSMFGYGGNLGHPTDPENGLIYMRARFYEPWTGRFLSEDPAGDGLNWYVYVSNTPTSYADRDGLYQFTLDGFSFRLDFDKGIPDIHIKQEGTRMEWTLRPNGSKNPHKGKPGTKIPARALKALIKSAKSDLAVRSMVRRMLELGDWGLDAKGLNALRRAAGGGTGAYTSLDAYFKQEPEDFVDTMRQIGGL